MDKVLCVDDSVMLLNYLREHFKRYADIFEFITARDGVEAIDILKQEHISLLITDLQMPKVDGLVLLAYTNKYHPSISCIVMTAHGTPKIKETLQPDILHYIEKPFKADALAQSVLAALKQDLPGGSLSGISIVNFLQMIEMEQKTCLCEVETEDNPKGFFYFQGGLLYHAVFGNLKGVEAALKMIQIDNATINFRKPPERKIPRRIKTELVALIIEAMRLKDESKINEKS
ncbi:response regulator [Desulfococcaceae bacterium HSG7]|nr:response regulator [Desulfococcaceae bacterium HSG9]MDM8555367.1 response regulator [Desulfococcaceae bacterium HSG7]